MGKPLCVHPELCIRKNYLIFNSLRIVNLKATINS